jgi:hypothetical protein
MCSLTGHCSDMKHEVPTGVRATPIVFIIYVSYSRYHVNDLLLLHFLAYNKGAHVV